MTVPHAGEANAGSLKPSDTTAQQLQEQMEQLADIFACIFGELTPEQRAVYAPERRQLKAA